MQIAHAHHTHGTSAAHHSKTTANAKAKHAAFGAMLSQMQTASQTSEAAPQKTEQPKPGANSQAIADEVAKNLDQPIHSYSSGYGYEKTQCRFFDHSRLDPDRFETIRYNADGTLAFASTGMHYLGPIQGTPLNGQPDVMPEKENIMRDLQNYLSKNKIIVGPNEKFNISVDKYLNVTVTGDDKEKAKAIEKLLNSPEDKNWGLLLHRHNSSQYFSYDQINKMLLENYIANASGNTVSLSDLYLSANGRIMGLPPELDNLINSMEPMHFSTTRQEREKETSKIYDVAREMVDKGKVTIHGPIKFSEPEVQKAFDERNKEEFVRLYVDGAFNGSENYHPHTDIKTELTKLLQKGVNNIPDANVNMVLGSNGLVFG